MWGMLDHLRKPSLAFESVIRNHFSFKKEEIMRQIERWCRDDEQFEDGEEEHDRKEEENAKEKEEEEVDTSKTNPFFGGPVQRQRQSKSKLRSLQAEMLKELAKL